MKDSQAMGVLSVAMNNPVGIAGMNAVFQGMMNMDSGSGGNGGSGNGTIANNTSSTGKNSNSNSNNHSSRASTTSGGGGMMGSMGSVSMSMGSMGSGGNSYANMGNVKKMNREEGEALRRAAAMSSGGGGGGGKRQQQHGYQNQYSSSGGGNSNNHKGSSSSSTSSPVFSMIFGGNNSGGPMPPNMPQGVSVPPLPPPPGGWPPGAAPAAAAAAAMAAFASSFNTNDPNNRGPDGNFQMPNMAGMGGSSGSNGQMPPPDFGSAAWLDYYDACLRAGGLKGGIAEFEEYARMSGQPGMIPPTGGGGSSIASSGGGSHHHHHRSMPQDRPIPRMGKEQDDDVVPAQFEYDDGTNNDNDSTTQQQQMSEQELQELAIEEEEKKKKKAAKKRDKKARQKERAKKEAEAKAALAAMKKRDKAIASWRSRIVQACGNEDVRKMDVLVGESPYKNYTYDPTEIYLPEEEEEDEDRPQSHEDYLVKHMDWFLANCLQKYQNIEFRIPQEQPFPNNSARECLAKLILSTSSNVVLLQGPGVKSRNAIHSAAYRNDADFIKWVIETCCGDNESDKKQYLESLCEDAGWAPLHYAIAGGSEDVVELLLANGCAVQTRTDRDLTCFNRYVHVLFTHETLRLHMFQFSILICLLHCSFN